LEYTLGNLLNYRKCKIDDIERYYQDLIVDCNEEGAQEIVFQHADIAEGFAFAALACGMIYSCDFDRYGMEKLATLLRKAFQTLI